MISSSIIILRIKTTILYSPMLKSFKLRIKSWTPRSWIMAWPRGGNQVGSGNPTKIGLRPGFFRLLTAGEPGTRDTRDK